MNKLIIHIKYPMYNIGHKSRDQRLQFYWISKFEHEIGSHVCTMCTEQPKRSLLT